MIAIIAILASMLLPALKNARDSSLEIVCKSHQKQIGLTSVNYQNDYNSYFVPPYIQNPTVSWSANWLWTQLLSNLYCEEKIDIFVCPSLPVGWNGNCGYCKNGNLGYNKDETVKVTRVRNTTGKAFCWDSGEYRGNHNNGANRNDPFGVPRVYYRHLRNCNVLFIDCHVKTVNFLDNNLIMNIDQ